MSVNMTKCLIDITSAIDYTAYIRNKLIVSTATESDTTMRNRTIAMIAIILSIVTIAVGYIASESAQYSKTITVKNGVAMVETASGITTLDNAYENDLTIPDQKITGYNAPKIDPKTPVMLPGTSAPYGTYTCDMGGFTVTNNTPCAER